MAQAAVELPNPLDQPVDSAANTDDLLSQLAGNEIDRLLAEADSDHAPKLFKPIKDSKIHPEPQALPDAGPKPDVAAQVGKILEKIDEGARTPAPAEEVKIAAAEQDKIDADANGNGKERAAVFEAAGFESSDSKPPDESSDVVEPGGSEREALLTAAGFDASAGAESAAPDSDAFDDPVPEYVAPLPFYLKPLQLINAPLEACPDHVRQLLGKLAIVTLINAVAGLAFVHFFKKH